jgi:hypothetical protein
VDGEDGSKLVRASASTQTFKSFVLESIFRYALFKKGVFGARNPARVIYYITAVIHTYQNQCKIQITKARAVADGFNILEVEEEILYQARANPM